MKEGANKTSKINLPAITIFLQKLFVTIVVIIVVI